MASSLLYFQVCANSARGTDFLLENSLASSVCPLRFGLCWMAELNPWPLRIAWAHRIAVRVFVV